jgi:hypothetical protein
VKPNNLIFLIISQGRGEKKKRRTGGGAEKKEIRRGREKETEIRRREAERRAGEPETTGKTRGSKRSEVF